MLERAKKLLWIATTPLALTILLAAPAAGESEQPVGEGHAPAVAEHHVVTNPIQNFARLHYGKDAHGGTWEAGEEKMPPPFLGALFNFAIFLFLLGKFAWPSIGRFVRDRHDQIAKQLDESARLRAEAQKKLEEYSAKLASVQGEIDRMVAQFRAEAEADRKRILAEAEVTAARLVRDAEMQVQAEIQRVRAALERETVLAAVAMAEKMFREKATDADQKALAERFVRDLEASAATGRKAVP